MFYGFFVSYFLPILYCKVKKQLALVHNIKYTVFDRSYGGHTLALLTS